MDKHCQQMKNSVRAELGRRAKEMKIRHVSRMRMSHELTTFMRPSRET